jgi:TP901 family phage tail tape measure protein
MAAARDSKGRFVKLGLGASMTFDTSQAMPGMKQALGMLNSMIGSFPKLGAGVGKFAGAMSMGASAARPLAGAIMAGANIAAEFEAQLSAVNAVLMTDEANMARLEKKAKELGASTKFTAKEAAEGMEMLASAGFTTEQVLSGIEGTLSLAAAGALDLGRASEITGNVINGMGLEAKDAGHVADVLAKVAADSATDVTAVGVAFKYSAAQARGMGISLEENAYMLGAMADAGMKGSSGGTALQNMLSKLAKPTEKGAELFKKMGLEMTEVGKDGKRHMKPVQGIVNEIQKELVKIEDPLKRAAAQEAVFGKIGQKGFSALAARGERDLRMTDAERNARNVDSFGQGVVDGAAKKMADLRLVGVLGSLEILKSAGEGLILEIFNKNLTAPIEQGIKQFTEVVSGITQVMQGLADGVDVDSLEAKFGPVITGIAVGLRDAITAVGEAIVWIKAQITEFFGESGSAQRESIAQWVKYAAIFAVIAAAIVPVVAVLAGIIVVVGIIGTAVTALGAIMAAVFWPVTAIGLALVGVYYSLARENETLGQTVSRVWGDISAWISAAWENSLKPLWEGLKYGAEVVWPNIKFHAVAAMTAIYGVVEQLFGLFRDFFPETEGGWMELGKTIAVVFGESIGWVLDKIRTGLETISWFIGQVRESFKMIASGEIIAGLAKLGSALLDLVLEPVREILKSAISIADAVYVPIPDAVRSFAFGGIGLENAKNRLGEDDLDKPKAGGGNFASYSYAPDVAGAQADLEAAKKGNDADEIGKAVGKAMEEAEAKKKGCETNVNSTLNLDGKKVAKNQAKIKNEMDERAGFKSLPYARRLMSEQGSSPGR